MPAGELSKCKVDWTKRTRRTPSTPPWIGGKSIQDSGGTGQSDPGVYVVMKMQPRWFAISTRDLDEIWTAWGPEKEGQCAVKVAYSKSK